MYSGDEFYDDDATSGIAVEDQEFITCEECGEEYEISFCKRVSDIFLCGNCFAGGTDYVDAAIPDYGGYYEPNQKYPW